MRTSGEPADGEGWETRRLSGAFADEELEEAFAHHRLQTVGRSLAPATLLASLIWVMFIPTDRAVAPSTAAWLVAAGLRLVAAAALVAVAVGLWRAPRWLATRPGQRGVTAAAHVCGASFLGVCAVRPVAVENLHLWIVLFGCALVLFAPMRLFARAVACATVYGGFVVVAAARFPPDHVHPGLLALSLLGAGVGALLGAAHLDRSARTAYALLRRGELTAAELARQAAEDDLTGLANRRAFFDAGATWAATAEVLATPVATVLLDLDHFKAINDTHGHAAGDAALRQIGEVLRRSLREGDVAGRLGGEEFALLLPGATRDEAANIADRVRAAIEATPLDIDGRQVTVTASVGVAERGVGEPFDSSLRRADDAMYDAKRSGGNRLVLAA